MYYLILNRCDNAYLLNFIKRLFALSIDKRPSFEVLLLLFEVQNSTKGNKSNATLKCMELVHRDQIPYLWQQFLLAIAPKLRFHVFY